MGVKSASLVEDEEVLLPLAVDKRLLSVPPSEEYSLRSEVPTNGSMAAGDLAILLSA